MKLTLPTLAALVTLTLGAPIPTPNTVTLVPASPGPIKWNIIPGKPYESKERVKVICNIRDMAVPCKLGNLVLEEGVLDALDRVAARIDQDPEAALGKSDGIIGIEKCDFRPWVGWICPDV